MNERGIYTGVVALGFLVLLGSTIIYLQVSSAGSSADIASSESLDVKLALENAAIVASKAISKGIFDGLDISDAGCSDTGAYDISGRINAALLEIRNKTGIDCGLTGSPATASGTLSLGCGSADGLVTYTKGIPYSKSVSIGLVDNGGDPITSEVCQYTITDYYSGLVELPAPPCVPGACIQTGLTCSGYNGCATCTMPDGTICDDGDPSTVNDVCTAGACAGSVALQPTATIDSPTARRLYGGDTITFTGSASGGSGTPYTYEWDFTGDGIADVTNTTGTAQWTFAGFVPYLPVTLAVMDSAGTSSIPVEREYDILTKPIAVWHFESNAEDEFGVHNGIRQGSLTYVPGIAGQAMHFGGDATGANYVKIPAAADLNPAQITISLWALGDSFTWGDMPHSALFMKGTDYRLLAISVTAEVWAYYYSSVWQNAVAAPSRANAWHNYTAVLHATGAKIYLDGSQAGLNPAVPTLTSLQDIYIGGAPPSFRSLSGAIDEVRMYGTVLSDAEIAYNFSNPDFSSP